MQEFEQRVKMYLENAGWRCQNMEHLVSPARVFDPYSYYPDHKGKHYIGCNVGSALLQQLQDEFKAEGNINCFIAALQDVANYHLGEE